ncbi:MAG: rod shape-determining protein [Lachnospiraceae bacterium]|nr:rod shape-determining protein [Lachnospiraceae bacterium]MBQ9561862.1 rod shape-determining protein [Lachnospiraceae bacterium]MBQ9592500.1 rod shape-determining protein [Lachnospiraceae bacterium]MBR0153645.1 rod shape-determining protein [Lachnospiraceae bacterium]
MAGNYYGIDFGSNSIKVYKAEEGMVYCQKNLIAKRGKNGVVAYGDEAYDMMEKAPEDIQITNPVKNGVITDIDNMQYMYDRILKELKVRSFPLYRPNFLVAFPFDITEVEKKAFYDVVESSQIRPGSVLLIERAISDGVGIGQNVVGTRGMMIVDVGYEVTEVSVVSLGGIVLSRMVLIGGEKLDEAVLNTIKRQYNVSVGLKTAELLKKSLSETPEEEGATLTAYGRHIVTGLPAEVEVEASVLRDAMHDLLMSIVDGVRIVLERTPPEISSDIKKTGIYLTGGSARIPELSRLLSEHTGLEVFVSDNCETAAVDGLGKIMESKELLKVFKELKKIRRFY